MTALPLVSVVMPTFNCARFVNEAISSVLTQDYPNLEVIVIDDGSTDGTLEQLHRHDARIRILQQENAGPAAARNRGASVARGEFIAFLDCDDVWLPGKISTQVQHLLHNPEVGLVHGFEVDWYPDKTGIYVHPPDSTTNAAPVKIIEGTSGWVYPQLLLSFGLCTSTVMLRRTLLEHVGGFDESYRIGEDYDLWLRLSQITVFHRLDMPCTLYRKHGSNVTKRPPERNYAYRALTSAITRYGMRGPDGRTADPEKVERYLATLCLSYAYHHFWWGDPCQARTAIESARRHGHRSARWLVYEIISWVRCLLSTVLRKRASGATPNA